MGTIQGSNYEAQLKDFEIADVISVSIHAAYWFVEEVVQAIMPPDKY
jgi:hypothetical protein